MHDRLLAPLDDVGDEEVRQIEAERGRAERGADLHQRRPVEMRDEEEIEQRRAEHDERHHEAEEQEGDDRRLAAIAGAGELFARIRRFQEIGQLELVDHLLHEAHGLGAQRRACCPWQARRDGARASSSRRSDTAFMRVPSALRSISGRPTVTIVAKARTAAIAVTMKFGSKRRSRYADHRASPSVLEADHFSHDEDSRRHPQRAAEQHEVAGALGEQRLDIGRRRQLDEHHHAGRQRADDHRRGLGFRRHRLDLALQALCGRAARWRGCSAPRTDCRRTWPGSSSRCRRS